MVGVKATLLIFAAVALVGGCGESKEAAEAKALALEEAAAIEEANRLVEISDPNIRKWIFIKPVGNTQYPKGELEKVLGLSLRGEKISDESLKDLAKFKGFVFLDLKGTQVTDAGLFEIAKLQKLRSLDLKGTQVTKAGVAELQKALPKCKISHDFE